MRSGLALAILAHVLLILALAWSVNWKASEPEGVVAELWSSLPQTAAPRAAPPEPKPAPPVVEPKPRAAAGRPSSRRLRRRPAPTRRSRSSASARRARRRAARRPSASRRRARPTAQARGSKREEAKRLEAKRSRPSAALAAEQAEKKKLAEQAKKEEARQAAIREANLRKMMKQAGSSDDPAARRQRGAHVGPVGGLCRPDQGARQAEHRPDRDARRQSGGDGRGRVAPDGTIVGRKLVTSSGSPAWDETVLRAIDKTEVLPKDVDGRVPPTITIDLPAERLSSRARSARASNDRAQGSSATPLT